MQAITRSLWAITVLAGILSLLACNESAKPKAELGAVGVETVKITAVVQSIDYANRTVTLQYDNGNTRTYRVSKDVINFDQIKPRDRVSLTAIESVAVAIRPPGGPTPYSENMTTVTLAPKGAKPGMIVTDTSSLTAQIVSIDTWNRKVTLKTPSGEQRVVKVASGVDMSQLKKGDDVVVRTTNDLAITVETP